MKNWDDLRVALAVARAGALAGAARRLGVDQTTVSRRLKALERDLGAQLFHRGDGRLTPTRAGETLLVQAEAAESAVAAAGEAVAGRDARPEGAVRVSSVATTVNRLLIPRADRLTTRYPLLRLELLAGEARGSLSRREADVALRFDRPGDGGAAFCRKIARIGYYAYAPVAAGDPQAMPWIVYEEANDHLPQARWLARRAQAEGVAPVLVNDAEGVLQAVGAGLGRSLLPRFVGDADARLRRLSDAPAVTRDLWRLSHRDIHGTKRGQAVVAWLEEVIGEIAEG
ncbi:MAG: LysR family transcriptional regulator [Marivibrio sp.]|uniref:LysR family transcriptional regulator n=1 Tax=Marivibrio sp. TaxID=2039719 RepID=UPI0032ED4154